MLDEYHVGYNPTQGPEIDERKNPSALFSSEATL